MPFDTVFSWIIKKRIDQIEHFTNNPIEAQQAVWDSLLVNAKDTQFGIEHGFVSISSYRDFKNNIPLRTYEDLFPYIEKSIQGQENILWPGKTSWFSKSSGTTNAKSKLIPVTQEAIQDCHYKGGKDLLSIYYHNNPGAKLFSGKHLILGGNTSVNKLNESSYFGDLSAIIVKNLPFWAEIRRTPNRQITLMENWEEKILKMAEASLNEDVKIIAGVPSWMMVLLNKIIEVSDGKSFQEVWPNLELYMHGGVNFEPYRNQFDSFLGDNKVNYYQTYNASEGFFALQDLNNSLDLLLMLDYGIFYEFIPMSQYNDEASTAIPLSEVKTGIDYALLITTNSGLWRYLIGDTVRFTSLDPYRIKITGRTKHYINVFGEELNIENVEDALKLACEKTNAIISDYTVGPIFMKDKKSGGHEWIIEFQEHPENMNYFTEMLDNSLKSINSDYEAKRYNSMTLAMPKIHVAKEGLFYDWLKKRDKLGGQHKIPRLSNSRDFVDELLKL